MKKKLSRKLDLGKSTISNIDNLNNVMAGGTTDHVEPTLIDKTCYTCSCRVTCNHNCTMSGCVPACID